MNMNIGDQIKIKLIDYDNEEVIGEIIEIHPHYLEIKEIEGSQKGIQYSIRHHEIIELINKE